MNPEIALRYWMIPAFDIFFLTAFASAVSYDCRGPVIPGLIRRGRSLNTNCRGLLHSSSNCRRAVSTGSSLSNTFTSSPGQLHHSTAQPPPLTQSCPLVKGQFCFELYFWLIKPHWGLVSPSLHVWLRLGGGREREREYLLNAPLRRGYRTINNSEYSD